MSNNNDRKKVSALDFFCIGFGAIVGVGWAVSINNWMVNSGGPVPAGLGYLFALIMMVPIALCYCELVPMLPVAGGGMAFAYKAFNQHVAVLSGWAAFGAFVAIIPWEAIQITTVLNYLIPGIKSGTPLYTVREEPIFLITIIIGTICSFLLFALNMRGLASAAFVQKILCVMLVAIGVVGAIAAVVGGGSIENLQPYYDNTVKEGLSHNSMFGGVLAILATAPFFLAGFETIPQGVEEAGGDIAAVGKTVVLSVALACIFYAMLLFCFGAGMPWHEFYGLDRPCSANLFYEVYGNGALGTFLYWLLVIGAMAGLFTTWNGFFMASACLLMGMARGRLMPGIFAKQNARGIPVPGLIVVLVLSLIGPFVGVGLIDDVTCFSGTAFVLSWFLTSCSLVALRKKHPNWHRPYKIPGGIGMGMFSAIFSGIVLVGTFIPSVPFYAGALATKMFFGWLVIGLVLYIASSGQRRAIPKEEREAAMFENVAAANEELID